MTLEDLEFYGASIRVELEHVPDDPDVGFVGYCIIDHVWINDVNWYSRGASNLMTSGAVGIIQHKVEAHISALEQLSKAERKAMAAV